MSNFMMYFMKRKWLTILILFASVFIVSYLVGSCKKHDIVHITTPLQQVIPGGFPQPVYRFEDNPLTEEGFENRVAAYKLEHSYAGIMGKWMEPVIRPLGFDWKIGIALITSFAAREETLTSPSSGCS